MTANSGSGRSGALAKLRARHQTRAGGAEAQPAPAARAGAIKGFDFSTLPEMEEMRFMRAAADTLGLKSMFFSRIDSRSGANAVIDGREMLNFASYDYLGLNGDPRVQEAAKAAIDGIGVSAMASRVVGGERAHHRSLETAIAEHYGVEDAVAMVSGHATNVTTIGALLAPEDLILQDSWIHNSIAEGARLSGATSIKFPHNDWAWVDRYLADNRARHRRVLIAVEGLYSMDGDMPDLRRFVEVKARHKAWLMVDEAHSLGTLGATGRGSAEECGIDPRSVEIWMGTMSKTLASCGGYIAGSRVLTEFLKFRASGFVFSVGLAPALAAAAEMALKLMHEEPERIAKVRANGARFLAAAKDAGFDVGGSMGANITPMIIGESVGVSRLSNMLYEDGIYAMPILYPAVPEKSARLRFFLTSDHTEDQIDRAVETAARRWAEIKG